MQQQQKMYNGNIMSVASLILLQNPVDHSSHQPYLEAQQNKCTCRNSFQVSYAESAATFSLIFLSEGTKEAAGIHHHNNKGPLIIPLLTLSKAFYS